MAEADTDMVSNATSANIIFFIVVIILFVQHQGLFHGAKKLLFPDSCKGFSLNGRGKSLK